MIRNEPTVEAARKELEQAYEKALRYALRYNSRWDRLEEAGERLRAFTREQQAKTERAA